jgi:hypothetical protein
VTLLELLTAAGDELAGVSVSVDAQGGLVWDRAGRPFAASSVDGASAAFRLDPAVAAAALRTPDTSSSRRGPDWVSFNPGVLDDHALDRAEAWFGSAWRRAERA